LPYDGNFRLGVGAFAAFAGDACAGGNDKVILITPGGVPLAKIADDVNPAVR